MNKITSPPQDNVVNGIRGRQFRNMIFNTLFTKAKLPYDVLLKMCTPQTIRVFEMAFTAPSADPEENYELLEFFGDAAYRKALQGVLVKRFPTFNPSQGSEVRGKNIISIATKVSYCARLEIILKSCNALATMAKDMSIVPYISASRDTIDNKMKPLLEDVLEAFIGALQYCVDQYVQTLEIIPKSVFRCVYNFVESLIMSYPIPTTYDDFFDDKSKFNVISNLTKTTLEMKRSPLTYKSVKGGDSSMYTTTLSMVMDRNGKSMLLATSSNEKFKKKDSEQLAAKRGIKTIENVIEFGDSTGTWSTESLAMAQKIVDHIKNERERVKSFFVEC